ncbi:biotin--[acetyl-CoA-carboxylase] ligase [Deinococcus sp.]|uniref:biotin--[acetyl-CoA-carboxylase] ligase n=1 Tax=Deinococcus sp. TaxID=47478 RepID=UPI002869E783|nr:biotin--[acetyl-CoA-carboxylase] ligase [Deinococcus sp.]
MPTRLLPLLTDVPQPGDALGARLGVNRVTVSTLARQLQEQGVPVQVTRAGYALSPGTPASALVHVTGSLGRTLRYAGTVGSTQDEVRTWADDPHDPAPHGAVMVAERQMAGRGRRGRVWDTTGGTLVFSVLLRPDSGVPLALADLSVLPLAAGVAVHAACRVGGLKWPNDLLAPDGRKLAGVLVEADIRGEEARRVIIGIGVNVTHAPPGAAHLSEWWLELTRAGLLGHVLDALDHWLHAPVPDVLAAWTAASVTLGRSVRVHTPQGTVKGTATRLDAHGSLIVETPGGPRTISAGDVDLIGTLAGGPAP